MNRIKLLAFALVLLAVAPAPLTAQEDAEGGRDHPLLTRMPGYIISGYTQKEFDAFEFLGRDEQTITVEGRKTSILYRPRDGAPVPSPLQIIRNCQNAITGLGGVVMSQHVDPVGGYITLRLVRGTNEAWIKVAVGDSGQNYEIVIVERAEMKQEVVASADVWKGDISDTGHAAVYGIYFDSDQSVIKAGSEKSLEEIAKLLQQNPKLSVLIVGHTDSTGEIPHNMALSEARAKAVVAALTGKYGVAAARLSAYGCGPLAPVASNDTEAGRARNRRVELVKR